MSEITRYGTTVIEAGMGLREMWGPLPDGPWVLYSDVAHVLDRGAVPCPPGQCMPYRAPTEQRTTEPRVAWEMKFGNTEIGFLCHETGEVYMSFNWNGTMVWEYVGHAGQKDFPKWLRRVATKMEKPL